MMVRDDISRKSHKCHCHAGNFHFKSPHPAQKGWGRKGRMNEEIKNAEGYTDMTAYLAIKEYQKGEMKMENAEYYQGDIVEFTTNGGDERLMLIVSSDERKTTNILSGIILNTETPWRFGVPITTTHGGIMFANVDMLSYVFRERLGRFKESCTEEELDAVKKAIAKNLDIESGETKEIIKEVPVERIVEKEVSASNDGALAEAKAEAKIYKDLYEKLLEKVMAR